jgi:hypothetical protein
MGKAGMEGLLGGCLIAAAVTHEVHECTFSCCEQMLWTEICTVCTLWLASKTCIKFQFLLWITSARNVTVTLFIYQKTTNKTIPADGDIQNF